MFQLKTIKEVLYSVGDLEKVKYFFHDYGGLEMVGNYHTHSSVLNFWDLDQKANSKEVLLQFDGHPTGLLRLIKFHGVKQQYIRSSQHPWDIGGIMDINLRVNEVAKTFEELRELGWHGLSDPLFQKMGPFELYDILMKGYDDTIVAFTHRTQPPLELKKGFRIPSHIYNSSITVKDLKAARTFYEEGLGFSLLNEYEVKKDSPQENMFGIPFNIIPEVTCSANIFSLDGTRDVVFQTIAFDGVEGKEFSQRAHPPNRGFLMYRCEVEGVMSYHKHLQEKGIKVHKSMSTLSIEPYGEVQCFALRSPNGVWWEFYEKV